eukprot:4919310-Pleurochrysis_carterae.AAC.1
MSALVRVCVFFGRAEERAPARARSCARTPGRSHTRPPALSHACARTQPCLWRGRKGGLARTVPPARTDCLAGHVLRPKQAHPSQREVTTAA